MKIGTITQVSGPVVDVEFEAGHLPKIKEALSVELNGQTRVMEVAQHMSERSSAASCWRAARVWPGA